MHAKEARKMELVDLSAYGGHARKICPDDGMVDMLDSKSGVCKDVRVRVPLWVQNGICN